MSCSCPVNSSAGNWCKVLMTSSNRCSWLCPVLLPRCRHSSVCTGQLDVSHGMATLMRHQTVPSHVHTSAAGTLLVALPEQCDAEAWHAVTWPLPPALAGSPGREKIRLTNCRHPWRCTCRLNELLSAFGLSVEGQVDEELL